MYVYVTPVSRETSRLHLTTLINRSRYWRPLLNVSSVLHQGRQPAPCLQRTPALSLSLTINFALVHRSHSTIVPHLDLLPLKGPEFSLVPSIIQIFFSPTLHALPWPVGFFYCSCKTISSLALSRRHVSVKDQTELHSC